MRQRSQPTLTLALLALVVAPGVAVAQESEEARIIALAETALERITHEDMVGLTDLMVAEASIYSIRPDGVVRYRDRTQERATEPSEDLLERGFAAEARVAGRIGTVWLPYDFYVDGEWSHCGVDVFTMLREGDVWKIVSIAYTVAQPPACEPHPDGPPRGDGNG